MSSTNQTTVMEYQRRVFSAMDYINQNLGEDLSLERIAREARFSKYHFHRLFRTLVGETVSGFSLRLRVEKSARELIWNTGKSITDIAFENGFSSSQHFATVFRSHFKITPSRYRNNFITSGFSTENYFITTLGPQRTDTPEDFIWPDLRGKKPFPHPVDVKRMDDFSLAYIRVIGSFIRPSVTEMNIKKLIHWAAESGIPPGEMVRVYWDDPDITLLEKYRSDDCIIVPEGTTGGQNINIQSFPGSMCAVCRVELTRVRDLKHVWRQFWPGWLLENEYLPADSPCFEIFHTIGDLVPDKTWVVDLCIPLEPL